MIDVYIYFLSNHPNKELAFCFCANEKGEKEDMDNWDD